MHLIQHTLSFPLIVSHNKHQLTEDRGMAPRCQTLNDYHISKRRAEKGPYCAQGSRGLMALRVPRYLFDVPRGLYLQRVKHERARALSVPFPLHSRSLYVWIHMVQNV